MEDASRFCFLIELTVALRTVPATVLPVVPRAVLRALGDHRNAESGLSWPKVETIAREAGCSESTARVALAQLLKAGWIAVVTPATPRSSARYEVRTTGAAVVVEPSKVPRVPGAGTQGAGSKHSGCREPHPKFSGTSQSSSQGNSPRGDRFAAPHSQG